MACSHTNTGSQPHPPRAPQGPEATQTGNHPPAHPPLHVAAPRRDRQQKRSRCRHRPGFITAPDTRRRAAVTPSRADPCRKHPAASATLRPPPASAASSPGDGEWMGQRGALRGGSGAGARGRAGASPARAPGETEARRGRAHRGLGGCHAAGGTGRPAARGPGRQEGQVPPGRGGVLGD